MPDTILFKTAMPGVALMLIVMIMAFRRHDQKCKHRSLIQWCIYVMRRLSLFLWAVISGLDAGYLKYRLVLTSYTEPLVNEETLGLLLGATETKEVIHHARAMVQNALA